MIFKILVILLALLGGAYSLILNIVQYRSANNPTPANLTDVYDAETYEKWKKYCAEHAKLSIVSEIIALIVTLAMLAMNVHVAFASLFPDTWFMRIFSIVLLEVAVSTVVGIIESYVSNMIIEQKYGFNRTSIKTFIFDRLRSLILGLLFSGSLAMLIAVIHENVGAWLILIFAACMFALTMLMTFLYPIFSRIGNKFTPLEDGELKEKLLALLNKYGYKVKAILVMDASRRTTKLNAYFTGYGKLKTIVLYDNLLNAMSDDEICAVFAHEMGHGLHKDVLKSQPLSVLNAVVIGLIALGVLSVPEFYTAFGFEGVNYGFAYVLISVAIGVIHPLISLISNAASRSHEYKADRQAVIEGYGEAMVTALKILAKDNFSHLAPSKLNVVLEYSHPLLDRRIEEIEKAINELKK